MFKKFGIFIVTVLLLFTMTVQSTYAASFGTVTSESAKTVSPDVKHIQRSYISGNVNRAVNILDINLSNPYTSIEVGVSDPINKLISTSSLAKKNNYEGHRVVGAINAAFFNPTTRYPSTVIAINNEILNFGELGAGTSSDSPLQKPVAFGIAKDGKAIADYYTTNFTYEINGKTYPFNAVNEMRYENTAVVYTEKNKTTGTNEWGREIVVENASKSTEKLGFGDVVTGTIKEITAYNTAGNSEIPANGFVISATGTAMNEMFDQAKVGDSVTINVGIDSKWQDAQFMMAAGPLLVSNGQVNISMSTTESFAQDRHPRTAVGIDATGKKVFFVTVDGRQSGYSLGSSLKDLGEYLISLGAESAINLDGGWSTTMVVRDIGTNTLNVANKPSQSPERPVSAILQVINTAPAGQAKAITLNTKSQSLIIEDTFTPSIKSGYDQYLNPITVNQENINWTVQGDIGYFDGKTFVATKAGTGKLIATYENATSSIDIIVTALPKEPIVLHSFDSKSDFKVSTAANATASVYTDTSYSRQGTGSLALEYDFKTGDNATKAAYIIPNSPLTIFSKPDHLGMWVYGDGNKNWLRGVVVDGNGTKHTIDFTGQSKLNWTGWKYVTAKIPEDAVAPYTFERLYIASPIANEWSKGKIYFDQLQAVYDANHEEPVYTDVTSTYWAFQSISNLNKLGLIKGYVDGTFKPNNQITRGEAAVILSGLIEQEVKEEIKFKDVDKNYFAYNAIQEVTAAGIFKGRSVGEFNPTSQLTRAEMAALIDRMYELTGDSSISFSDVKTNHWAYESITRLAKSGLVAGYVDGTFKPDNYISRVEFATILNNAIK